MLSSSKPRFGTRVCSGATLAASILAAVLTTIVFLIDVIFVAVVRDKLNDEFDGQVRATWGSGVSLFLYSGSRWLTIYCIAQTWMMLAAAILLWISCFGACCGIFAWGGRHK